MFIELTPTQRSAFERRKAFHTAIAARAAARKITRAIEAIAEAKPKPAAPVAPVATPAQQAIPPADPLAFSTPEDLGIIREYPSVAKIQKCVCKYRNLSKVELLSRCRTAKYVEARHLAFYLCRMLTPHSYPDLGRRFGHMDHTSILHGVVKVAARMERDPVFAEEVRALMDQISPEAEPQAHVVRSEAS